MRTKMEITIGITIVLLVMISLATYYIFAGPLGLEELATAAILIVIVFFAAFILWDKAKNVSKGLPAKDERITGISYKAGYYGFIAVIWTAVFAPVLASVLFDQELEGHIVTALVVIVSGFVFAISYLYLARKGH